MTAFDFSVLEKIDSDYRNLIKNAKDSFNCAWDDEIHDSYSKYLLALEEYGQVVHDICNQAKKLANDLDNLKIDVQIERAVILCQEADAICADE